MATDAFLDVERYSKANNDWEEKDHTNRTWKNWKALYLKAAAKALIKQKANGSVENFERSALS